jgi:hypothetical protein
MSTGCRQAEEQLWMQFVRDGLADEVTRLRYLLLKGRPEGHLLAPVIEHNARRSGARTVDRFQTCRPPNRRPDSRPRRHAGDSPKDPSIGPRRMTGAPFSRHSPLKHKSRPVPVAHSKGRRHPRLSHRRESQRVLLCTIDSGVSQTSRATAAPVFVLPQFLPPSWD